MQPAAWGAVEKNTDVSPTTVVTPAGIRQRTGLSDDPLPKRARRHERALLRVE